MHSQQHVFAKKPKDVKLIKYYNKSKNSTSPLQHLCGHTAALSHIVSGNTKRL